MRPGAVTAPLFAIPLGFTGLGICWSLAGDGNVATDAVADGCAFVALVLVIALVGAWSAGLPAGLRAEFAAVRTAPSLPVAPLSAMLAFLVLLPDSAPLLRILVLVFGTLTVGTGAAVALGWLLVRPAPADVHPGFLLPTVAAPLLTAQCCADVGWHGAAQVLLAVGVTIWLTLGILIVVRLRTQAPLPDPLVPTLVLGIAAAALATNTYLVVVGRFDAWAVALTAVTVAMGVVQAVLTPRYVRVWFVPGFWSFAFTYATVTTLVLRWLEQLAPHTALGWRILVVVPVTVLVGVLVRRTVVGARVG